MKQIQFKLLDNLLFLFIIIILIFTTLLVSWKLSINTSLLWTNISINEYTLTWVVVNDSNTENIEIKLKNDKWTTWDWINFLSIFTTLLAAFFIYSSWKIDNDLRKISDVKENLENIENEAIDNTEFSLQLKYAIHYMMSKQYNKAIDSLIVLRAEPFTLKDDRKLNSCNYFLAVCYYEQWQIDNDIDLLSRAVQFINEAIEDEGHPLRKEIIAKFSEMSKIS